MTFKSPLRGIQSMRKRHAALYGGGLYYQKVLRTNPIAYWPLWETSGTTAQCLVNSAQNGTYSSDVSGWPVGDGIGDGNTAPQFDGTNNYININTATFISAFNSDELTWMFWIKPQSAARWSDATRSPFTLVVNASNYTRFSSYANPNVQLRWAGGGTQDNVTVVESSSGWRQYALTVSKTVDELKAYRDGEQQGLTQDTLGNWVGSLATCIIGAESTVPGNPWYGQIAHVVVWDNALSTSAIKNLYII